MASAELPRKRKRAQSSTADSFESAPSFNTSATPSSPPPPPVLASAPAAPAPPPAQLNEELRETVKKMYKELECRVCMNLLTAPFTLSCGHTFCYQCIDWWWDGGVNETCQLCRTVITECPVRSHLIGQLAETIKPSLHLVDESADDYETRLKEAERVIKCHLEARHLDNGRKMNPPAKEGLFQGMFVPEEEPEGHRMPFRDPEDQIWRCPECNWEVEDDDPHFCSHCGAHFNNVAMDTDNVEDTGSWGSQEHPESLSDWPDPYGQGLDRDPDHTDETLQSGEEEDDEGADSEENSLSGFIDDEQPDGPDDEERSSDADMSDDEPVIRSGRRGAPIVIDDEDEDEAEREDLEDDGQADFSDDEEDEEEGE